ncbi:hypothetical protein AAG570_005166 [Ranatra chinensis]|uniref:Uncharacterized protein n=1 Tax=Ranatra chinensis TaxID=642074 RepID=A0ABD0XZM7_9HEMI
MSMDIGKNYYSPTSEDLAVLYWWWITSSAWVIQVFLMAPAAVRSSWKYLHCISTCRLLYCLYLASTLNLTKYCRAKDTYNGLKAFHTDCPLLFVELHCLEMCQLRMADLLELKRDIGQRDSAWREKRRRLLLTQQQLEGHHRRMQAPLGLALFINFVDILLAGYRLVGASRTPSEQLAIRAAILAAPAALKFARIWSICRGITGMENEVIDSLFHTGIPKCQI